MIWLIIYNWFQLILAFAGGLIAAWWVLGRPGSRAQADVYTELAAERAKLQEINADRARLRAKAEELSSKLNDVRRQLDRVRATPNQPAAPPVPAPARVAKPAPAVEPEPAPQSQANAEEPSNLSAPKSTDAQASQSAPEQQDNGGAAEPSDQAETRKSANGDGASRSPNETV